MSQHDILLWISFIVMQGIQPEKLFQADMVIVGSHSHSLDEHVRYVYGIHTKSTRLN